MSPKYYFNEWENIGIFVFSCPELFIGVRYLYLKQIKSYCNSFLLLSFSKMSLTNHLAMTYLYIFVESYTMVSDPINNPTRDAINKGHQHGTEVILVPPYKELTTG